MIHEEDGTQFGRFIDVRHGLYEEELKSAEVNTGRPDTIVDMDAPVRSSINASTWLMLQFPVLVCSPVRCLN